MKNIVMLTGFLLAGFMANAQSQNSLNIDSCYAMAKAQYPLIKQRGLIEKTREYSVSNASKGYLPQFSINGQATYQSAVTTITLGDLPPQFSNIKFPTPTKDQYNIHGELDQVIYDGGSKKEQKLMQETNADIQQQNLDVQLYALKDRVNQLYFGVLLQEQQIKQNQLLQKDIQTNIDKMQANVNNGIAYRSSVDELQAELLQQQQNEIQLKSSRKAYLDMLGVFINQPLGENTLLQTPGNIVLSDNIKRPELSYYDSQKKSYDVQDEILNANNRPKLSFYLQGGYAKPGLNAFDTNFEPYYIGGLKLSWVFGGFYSLKNSQQLLNINRQTLDLQKETFLFNTNVTLKQQKADIDNLQQLINKDNEIILKRKSVTNAAKAKMENGVITVHEYVNELDTEDQAIQSQLLHQVQLLMTEYNYQNTTGN